MNPIVEVSSLTQMEEGGQSKTMSAPNFVTECFFLVHILINFMSKKLEQKYKENNDLINSAIDDKDMEDFDEGMAFKLCMDVHVIGKNTLILYRSLLSFTNALMICTGMKFPVQSYSFTDLTAFLNKVSVHPSFTE